MAILGAHISVSKGLLSVIQKAKDMGAKSVQIFGASPRQWRVSFPSQKEAEQFKLSFSQEGLGPLYLHASYLLNLATENKALVSKSITNLLDHYKIAKMLGAQGIIFHPGSAKKGEKEKALEILVESIKKIFKETDPTYPWLIVENTSGGGGKLLGSLQEFKLVIKRVNSQRLKVCLDTCHIFSAGFLKFESSKEIKSFFEEFDNLLGLKNLVVLHLNDSKGDFGSKIDRHENIGEGKIGIKGFKLLAKEKSVNHLPWIIETPGFDQKGPDKKNLDILRKLF